MSPPGDGATGGVSRGLLDRFGPERVRNTPISESAIIGSALGAALTGSRPVAELMFMDLICVSMDQIVNQVAKVNYMFGGKAKAALVIRTPGGAGVGAAAQHSQNLEAWLVHTPGLVVVQPSTPYDAKGLLKTAIRDDNPIFFVEHKALYPVKGPGAHGGVPDSAGGGRREAQGARRDDRRTAKRSIDALQRGGRSSPRKASSWR